MWKAKSIAFGTSKKTNEIKKFKTVKKIKYLKFGTSTKTKGMTKLNTMEN